MNSHVQRKLLKRFYRGSFARSWGADHAGEPLSVVKPAADGALAVIDPKPKAPDKKQQRIERRKEINNSIFDYEETARHSPGPH